jgi:hypothetical protein
VRSLHFKAESLTRILDVLIAPAAAAQRIARDPQYLTPLILCFALPLAANLALIQPRNALGGHETILTALWSAVEQGIGAAVWIFLCFLLIGAVTGQQRIRAVAWSFGVNGSIVAAGIPALAQAIVVLIVQAASGSTQVAMTATLPSLGWLVPQGTIRASMLAPFDIFLIWQMVLFSQFLVAFGLSRPARWLLGAAIAVIPAVIFFAFTSYIFSLAHV